MQGTYNIIDSVAGAADASLANRMLSITGAPAMKFTDIQGVDYDPFTPENLKIVTVTPTAANSTTFALRVRQDTAQGVQEYNLSYTTGASGDTATTICNAWRAQLARLTTKIAGTGTTTFIMTAVTGFKGATFTVTNTSDAAATVTQATTTSIAVSAGHATPGTAVSGTTTVTIVSAAAHGLAVGNRVTITAATGFTFTDNITGVAYPVTTAVNVRVATVADTVTFTLDRITGSGTNSGAAVVITPLATNANNSGTLLNAGGYTGFTNATNYNRFVFTYEKGSGKSLTSLEKRVKQHELFVNAGDTDYEAFNTQLVLLLRAVATTATSYEPVAII